MNTDDHADAAIEGLQDTGIRSVFAFGFPNTSIQTWWFGPDWTRLASSGSTATSPTASGSGCRTTTA